MSRESILIVLGVVIALISFVGVPLLWRSILLPIIGALIVLIGVTLRGKKMMQTTDNSEPSSTAPAPQQNF